MSFLRSTPDMGDEWNDMSAASRSGTGPEHPWFAIDLERLGLIDPSKTDAVFAYDINGEYLSACDVRYRDVLGDRLHLVDNATRRRALSMWAVTSTRCQTARHSSGKTSGVRRTATRRETSAI